MPIKDKNHMSSSTNHDSPPKKGQVFQLSVPAGTPNCQGERKKDREKTGRKKTILLTVCLSSLAALHCVMGTSAERGK